MQRSRQTPKERGAQIEFSYICQGVIAVAERRDEVETDEILWADGETAVGQTK